MRANVRIGAEEENLRSQFFQSLQNLSSQPNKRSRVCQVKYVNKFVGEEPSAAIFPTATMGRSTERKAENRGNGIYYLQTNFTLYLTKPILFLSRTVYPIRQDRRERLLIAAQ